MPNETSPKTSRVRALIIGVACIWVVIFLLFWLIRREPAGGDKTVAGKPPESVKIDPKTGKPIPSSDSNATNENATNPNQPSTRRPPGIKPAEEEPDEPGTLTTSGYAVDQFGKGVPGLSLIAYLLPPGLGNVNISDPPMHTETKADGTFAFRGIRKFPERILKIAAQSGKEWVVQPPVQANPGDRDVRLLVVPVFSKGKIFGQVMDRTTKAPVAGYKVAIARLQQEITEISGVTDADGRFSFEGLKTSPYKILSPAPKSGRSLRSILDPRGGDTTSAAFGVIMISPQNPEAERQLILGGPFKLTGKVVDANSDKPMPGVTIHAVEGNGDERSPYMKDISAVSEKDGGFVMEDCGSAIRPGLSGGGVVGIHVGGDGILLINVAGGTSETYADPPQGIAWVAFEKDDATSIDKVVLKVAKSAPLKGTVKTADGLPYEGARVFACENMQIIRQSPSLINVQAVTKADGLFSIGVPPMKSLYAGAQTPDGGLFFSSPVAMTSVGAETTIIVERETDIDGLVLDPEGKPVEGAEVTLSGADGRTLATTGSDNQGRFGLKRPGGAQTKLQAIKAGYFPSEPMNTARFERGAPLVLVLGESAFIKGIVVDPQDAPVAGASISLFGDGAADFNGAIQASGGDGRFEIGPLRKGKPHSAVVQKGNIDVAAYGLVPGGEEKKIVLKLDILLHCVITVSNPQKEPIFPYTVSLHPDRTYAIDRNPSGSGPWICQDPTGKLELQLSPASSFFFQIDTEQFGSSTSYKIDWDYVANMANVSDLIFEFPIVLGSSHTVTGKLVSQSHAEIGLPGIQLSLVALSPKQGSAIPGMTTGPDGSFTFPNVASGGYELVGLAPPRPDLHFQVFFSKDEDANLGSIPFLGLGKLQVKVSDAGGAPKQGAWVELIDTAGVSPPQPNRETNARGEVVWDSVPEGKYMVKLPAYGRLVDATVEPNQTAELNIQLGAYKLAVNVGYKNEPMNMAWVRLKEASSGQMTTIVTSQGGTATFENMPEGNYEVSASWPQGFFSAQGITYSPFTAPKQNVKLEGDAQAPPQTLYFVMPSGMISGSVTENYVPTPESPAPAVELYCDKFPGERLITYPDQLHLFYFPGLPAGNFTLHYTSRTTMQKHPYTLNDGQEITDIEMPAPQPPTP